ARTRRPARWRNCRWSASATALRLIRLERPPGAVAPVLPGAVDAVGAGAGRHLLDLARSEELDLAHAHRLLLQSRVHLEVDRDVDGVADVAAGDGRAVPAHQSGAPLTHQLRQVASHLHALDQQRGIAEMVMRIPDRDLGTDRGAHVEDGLDPRRGDDPERDDALAV